MMKEQIAELRASATNPDGSTSDHLVFKALEEREQLLVAAAHMDAWIARYISGDPGSGGSAVLADLRNAIKKAEDP